MTLRANRPLRISLASQADIMTDFAAVWAFDVDEAVKRLAIDSMGIQEEALDRETPVLAQQVGFQSRSKTLDFPAFKRDMPHCVGFSCASGIPALWIIVLTLLAHPIDLGFVDRRRSTRTPGRGTRASGHTVRRSSTRAGPCTTWPSNSAAPFLAAALSLMIKRAGLESRDGEQRCKCYKQRTRRSTHSPYDPRMQLETSALEGRGESKCMPLHQPEI